MRRPLQDAAQQCGGHDPGAEHIGRLRRRRAAAQGRSRRRRVGFLASAVAGVDGFLVGDDVDDGVLGGRIAGGAAGAVGFAACAAERGVGDRSDEGFGAAFGRWCAGRRRTRCAPSPRPSPRSTPHRRSSTGPTSSSCPPHRSASRTAPSRLRWPTRWRAAARRGRVRRPVRRWRPRSSSPTTHPSAPPARPARRPPRPSPRRRRSGRCATRWCAPTDH